MFLALKGDLWLREQQSNASRGSPEPAQWPHRRPQSGVGAKPTKKLTKSAQQHVLATQTGTTRQIGTQTFSRT